MHWTLSRTWPLPPTATQSLALGSSWRLYDSHQEPMWHLLGAQPPWENPLCWSLGWPALRLACGEVWALLGLEDAVVRGLQALPTPPLPSPLLSFCSGLQKLFKFGSPQGRGGGNLSPKRTGGSSPACPCCLGPCDSCRLNVT